ncbi:MAG: aminotransferase class I/II-fold pyridoxal phosphate-dependent enzyme [Kordiimonadaceae bacterium]|nr:aminotransferase class I/II-fold pyridoxal phosphate-dependent enzyme [Kordiimonadaceae bacterium]
MTNIKLDRRLFMKGVGAAAFVTGAVNLPAASASAKGMGSMGMSMAYDLNEEYNRIGAGDFKWDGIRKMNRPYDVPYPMGVADMDFRTCPHVTEALQTRLNNECWGYEAAPEDYIDNIVAWNKARYNQTVNPKSIKNSLGVLDGVTSVLRTVTKPGDKIILHTPNYSSFFHVIPDALCELAESDLILKKDGTYDFDYDDTERLLKEGASAIIICNPQNPTGNCWTAEQLGKIGDLAEKYNAFVVADEIHCDFVNKHAKYTPYASVNSTNAKNSATFKSASKSFNLAAHRTAYMFCDDPDFMDRVEREANHYRALMHTMGTIASNAAYKHGAQYMDDMQSYMDKNAHILEDFCAKEMKDVSYKAHEGTYLAWINCSKVAKKLGNPMGNETVGDMMQRFFIQKAGVNLNPGEHYGRTGEGYMRMNLATQHSRLHRALEAMQSAIKNI